MADLQQNIDFTYTQNRELSWLRFNERVLEEAADPMVPLYERLKFVSIFTSNLDEFFMIRVGSIGDLALVRETEIDNKSGQTPQQQLLSIFRNVEPLYAKRDRTFARIEGMLREYGICNLAMTELERKEKEYLREYYHQQIQPVLSPQIIDPHHPFPHLENKQLYVILMLRRKDKNTIAILPVPASVPPIILLPGSSVRYVMTEQAILQYADQEFDKYTVTGKVIISVTRNGDITSEENDETFDSEEDFRLHMKKVLKKRKRLAPVRLEYQGELPAQLYQILVNQLGLSKNQVYSSKTPLCMSYVYSLQEYFSNLSSGARQKISYVPFTPQPSGSVVKGEPVLSQLERGDILLSYPYEQMEPFLSLLREASSDPAVLSIRITIYRLAKTSRLADYLISAAENGKDVTVLMELRARFDEQNNINWAEMFENAGCKVIYGFEGYKVHSKICLITRRAPKGVQYITQIGTGNYNEKTAKLYTDFSLMTMDQRIGSDAASFFRNMAISNLEGKYQHLLVSPHSLKPGLMRLIDEEIEKAKRGEPAKIVMKMNSITDRDMIDKLAQASQAGVEVQMIVRGICCLLPGIAGKTENIHIRSIVGRFLEHSRIYCFGQGTDIKIYIGSADLMTRNTVRRVEITCPIYSETVKKQILQYLDVQLSDNVKARMMQSDGSYLPLPASGKQSIDAQACFMDFAIQAAQNAAVYDPKETAHKLPFSQRLRNWMHQRSR